MTQETHSNISKQFIAVRALIKEKTGKFLIIRESPLYKDGNNINKWDFPGGKVELGENIYDALKREVKEETGLEIIIKNPFFIDEWFPTIKNKKVQIIGIFFLCEAQSTNVKLSKDHDLYQWVTFSSYKKFNLISQNIKAIETLKNIKYL